jgi:hypothetical protein
MEGNILLPASLAELRAAHPEVGVPCCVEGHLYVTVDLDCGFGYVHAEDEAGLLVKLTAALGG